MYSNKIIKPPKTELMEMLALHMAANGINRFDNGHSPCIRKRFHQSHIFDIFHRCYVASCQIEMPTIDCVTLRTNKAMSKNIQVNLSNGI